MNVLVLGNRPAILPILKCDGYITDKEITPEFARNFDFIISYGYRHILKKDILDLFPDKAINLHISMLPWNRGSDPNLWSFIDDTPKGVTIHYMNEGLDKGDIIAQREVTMGDDETLKTSYDKLQSAMIDLFRETWPEIIDGMCVGRPQEGIGSYHKSTDKNGFILDVDTPIRILLQNIK